MEEKIRHKEAGSEKREGEGEESKQERM